MPVNYIVLAIPVFLLLIAVEVLFDRWHGHGWYHLNDSLNDLACGILSQFVEVFLKTALFAGYLYLYGHWRLMDISERSIAAWVLCFLGVDFFYYWFHRTSHEVNAVWATHVVHHQSEEFNLSVALRQGALQGGFSWVYYLPLAVIGFPPLMFLTLSSFNTLYQFWIHTRAIDRMGPLEWVLNTPSHHRVHHGRNPKYIDRNHAGSLIIWDRMFGTFQAEEEEPVYGITKPLASWNPVWANLHYWVELAQTAGQTKRFGDRIRLFLKPPGWRPEDLGGFQAAPEVDPASYRKFDTPTPAGMRVYAFLHLLPVIVGSSLLFHWHPTLGAAAFGGGALVAVGSLLSLGWLVEGRPHAIAFERLRLAVAGLAGVASLAEGHYGVGVALAVAVLVSLPVVLRPRPAALPGDLHPASR